MTRPVRLGVLTPSSNTVLEPVTSAIVAELPGVSAHFARFRVTEISAGARSAAQFELEPVLAAARLLVDARVDAIVWSGTSAGWLGIERDAALIEAIERETGVRAGAAVSAIDALLAAFTATRIGLVTPYVDEVQSRIVDNWAARGISCVAERHLGLSVNFEFATVTPARLEAMIEAVAVEGVEAVVVLCTNLDGARAAVRAENALGLPVIDSTAAAAWRGLRLAGIDTVGLSSGSVAMSGGSRGGESSGWGRLFSIG